MIDRFEDESPIIWKTLAALTKYKLRHDMADVPFVFKILEIVSDFEENQYEPGGERPE